MADQTAPSTPSLIVNKEERTIITTIALLFKSRRFLVLFGSVLISLIIYKFPELKPMQENMGWFYLTVIGVIGSYSAEDIARTWNEGKDIGTENLPANIQELVGTALQSFLEEAFPKETPGTVSSPPPADTSSAPVG